MQFLSLGNGKNGKIPVGGGAINSYATVIGTSGTNDVFTTLPVAIGDFVVLWQTQGGAGDGHYELVVVNSIVDSGHFKAASNLVNTYTTGAQAITCPQYSGGVLNGTLVPTQAWDGSIGGAVVFASNGGITGTGGINVSGYGFRGGNGGPATSPGTTASASYQGESEPGVGSQAYTPNSSGGGGSTGSGSDAGNGGGGGGHANAGTAGLPGQAGNGQAGTAVGDPTIGTLHFGGGGGGGRGEKNGSGNGGNGGRGGGVALLFVFSINLTGLLQCNGVDGSPASPITNTDGAGGGGGGAAGTFLIYCVQCFFNTMQALGGVGGQGGTSGNNPSNSVGGNGSVGRIGVYCCSHQGNSNPPAYINEGGHSFCGTAVQII